MDKYYIRYHIVGNKVVMDVQEFESFAEAVTNTAKRLQKEVIGIVKNDGYVVEILTKYITHHEVMNEAEYKKQRKQIEINNLLKPTLMPGI